MNVIISISLIKQIALRIKNANATIAKIGELTKKIKEADTSWRKSISFITGKGEKESVFKIEGDKLKNPKKLKKNQRNNVKIVVLK